MTLGDLAKYSMTRSVARSLCDSWVSCYWYSELDSFPRWRSCTKYVRWKNKTLSIANSVSNKCVTNFGKCTDCLRQLIVEDVVTCVLLGHSVVFFRTKPYCNILTKTPNEGAECRGYEKNRDFRSINRFISEMIHDRARVTIEFE